MSYFLGYFVTGLLVVLSYLVQARKDLKQDSKEGWFFNYVFMPIFIFCFLPIFWPLLIYFKIYEQSIEKKTALQEEEFSVSREDFLQRMDINQIEEQEYVVDPLCAVPSLPFGHMNTTWLKFIAKLDHNDEIWSFSKQWDTGYGRDEIRSGYVVVRDGTISPYFYTTRKIIDED
jgi:hypothetical protein